MQSLFQTLLIHQPSQNHPYDADAMLFTIVSLLLFVIFVIFLHTYARWFLSQARPRTPTSTVLPHAPRRRVHHRFTAGSGLPSPIIASLPLFVHRLSLSPPFDLECIICLSVFQDEEIGKKLPGCGHAFHVDCIDMWLHSHSTCPICRAAILYNNCKKENVNRVADHVEIDVVVDDPEQLEVDDAIRYPVEESPKSMSSSLEIHCGPSCSSS